ncbi:serine hydrolase domain-containing protein [Streptomyces sp. CMB-StM0423]|uniref:serine hydrolase domain-containing protein n=1 Tax=Streptomyces sp. CMB-StM0423 TaxID=2059884 RepID=UPI00131BBCE9|nr:serine hydrolase domain-containing protein [Streptomyces sp. CMB-StM0423]
MGSKKVLVGTAAMVVTTLMVSGSATAVQSGKEKSGQAKSDAALIQKELDRYRVATGSIGAAATIRNGDTVQGYGSGSTQLFPTAKPNEDTRFRVGSQTKMFVATIVLQLVEEGRIDLNKPIEDYLPGVVQGTGLDPKAITVRHLLQHRSGIKDNVGFVNGDYLQSAVLLLNPTWQVVPPSEQQMVNEGTKAGKQFDPGTKGQYSNTGYVVLGMLVKKVTGRDLATEVRSRIVEPLGLKSTFYPRAGEKGLPGPYSRGYLSVSGLPLADVTNYEPAVWGAAGALVSTGRDLTTFLNALLEGELLPRARLAEMQKLQTVDKVGAYGLGLQQFKTDCKDVWGHTGQIAGYTTMTVSDGKRAISTGVNNTPVIADGKAQTDAMIKMVNDAICA